MSPCQDASLGTVIDETFVTSNWLPWKNMRTGQVWRDAFPKTFPGPRGMLRQLLSQKKCPVQQPFLGFYFSPLNLTNGLCNLVQTFSIHNVPREEFHRLTIRKSSSRQRKVSRALSSYAALSQQVADEEHQELLVALKLCLCSSLKQFTIHNQQTALLLAWSQTETALCFCSNAHTLCSLGWGSVSAGALPQKPSDLPFIPHSHIQE